MGFAVVADEVRNLAQKSANAARETAEKIEGAIARTDLGVRTSEKVAGCLAAISGQIKDMEGSLTGMADKAQEVDRLIAEIAASSEEQNQGIEQINKAVSQMDKLTQSNAASAEESAGVSEQLKSQAASLMLEVSQLRILTGDMQAPQASSSRERDSQIAHLPEVVTDPPSSESAASPNKSIPNVLRSQDLTKTNGSRSDKAAPKEEDFENF